MKCPYCDCDMVKGYLNSAAPIFWSYRKVRLAHPIESEGDTVLSKGGFLHWYNGDSYICSSCGKIIIDLSAPPPNQKLGTEIE